MSTTGVDDEEILAVLREGETVEHSTTEVAEQLPIGRGQTRNRLQQLVDEDRLRRRRDGNSVVWWLPEREDEREDDPEGGEETATSTAENEVEDAAEDVEETVEETAEDVVETVDEAVDDVGETVEGTIGDVDVAPPEPPEPSELRDDRARQLALALAAVVVVLLLRRLLSGSDDAE